MGFLDMFDNPDIMGQLFGINPASAAESPPSPPASPPPDVMAEAPKSFAPNSAVNGYPDLGNASSPNWRVSRGFQDAADPAGNPSDPASLAPAMYNEASNRGVGSEPPGPVVANGLPLPPPRPSPPPPAPVQPPVPPQVAAAPPPAPPPMNPAAGPPSSVVPDGLAQALGLNAPTVDPRKAALSSAMAGLGKGLSAVGNLRPGAGKGAAIAAGLGGSLTGANEDERQKQNDNFNQKSQAFKDWIAGEKLGDDKLITAARAKYYESLADMRKNGMAGSNAWQNTPYGKASALETMLDRWENNKRLQLQAKWKASSSTPDEVKGDLDQLAKDKESERARRAQALSISPTEYKKGTARENAFDMEKLSPTQRNVLPDGAWYRYKDPADPKADKDGYVYKQRDWLTKPPYEGWQPSQQSAPQGTQAAAPDPYSVEQQDQTVMAG